MYIADICTKSVVTCHRDITAHEAARLMREHHVGDLVVVDDAPARRPTPIGIVTDRSLVLRVMAIGWMRTPSESAA